jgi:hypothetical protein
MSNVKNIKTKRTYIKIRMQNIRVTNGHTKELQRGCAKGQKKEQPPKRKPTARARTPDLPVAGLPLCRWARDSV